MLTSHVRPRLAVLIFAAIAAVVLGGIVLNAAQPASPLPAGPKAGSPPGAPAPAATAATPAKPKPKPDPKLEALTSWVSGIFTWGPGDTTAEEVPNVRIRGYKLYRVMKSFALDSRANDQAYAAVDDTGHFAIVGDAFADEPSIKKPHPIRTDADLEALRDQIQKYLRGRTRLVLDPASDRPGFRGVKAQVDSGYGPFEIGGFVTAEDGSLLILGRAWDRKRSIPEQRREMIKIAGTPVSGPADATITVVEYSDMQCGFCKKRTADWEPLLAKLGSMKIRRYFKSFPLTDHTWAFRAAAAGRCFFEKDPALFFRWKSNVYNRQEQLTVSDLDLFALDFANANDLGEAWFKGCYLQEKDCRRILADVSEGFSIRVRATPTYFIDGVAVSWFADGLMEEFLQKTYRKGTPAAAKTTRQGKR